MDICDFIQKYIAAFNRMGRPPSVREVEGRVVPRYSGADRRRIRAQNGVGRPPGKGKRHE